MTALELINQDLEKKGKLTDYVILNASNGVG